MLPTKMTYGNLFIFLFLESHIAVGLSEFRKVFRFAQILCPGFLPRCFHLKFLFA